MASTSTARQPGLIDGETRHFARLAGNWWDPRGSSAMLHKLGPVRLAFIRDRIDQHWQCDENARRPLDGKSALDVGCGGGLLAEPLARLGASVTAIDPVPELVEVARAHAAGQHLAIDYRCASIEQIEGKFDLVTAMEVIEHVAHPAAFVAALAERLAPGGLVILSTPNRTAWSRLLTITLAEGVGAVPKGTHDFDRFIAPDAMRALLAAAGLEQLDCAGIAWSPTRGLHLSEDLRLNYLMAAKHC